MAKAVVIMAGGTGGHVFPALAVAGELQARGWSVSWLGTPDSFESRIVPQNGYAIDFIPAYRLRGQGVGAKLLAPFRMVRALWSAMAVLKKRKPRVVLGFGGFVTGPGGLAGKLLGLKLVVHEQNSIPGLTNKVLSRIADIVLEAFPGSFQRISHVRCTGNPVRNEIAAIQQPEQRTVGRNTNTRLLVIGGSLGAQVFNEMLPIALEMLKGHPIEVRHQSGRGQAEQTAASYRLYGVDAVVSEFIQDMAEAYVWADIIVCRAGALTIAELAAVGLPAILIPFPHAVDDHQTNNARYLENAGAALLIKQSDLSPALLAQKISALAGQPEQLIAMAKAGRKLAQPMATTLVADACEEVAA